MHQELDALVGLYDARKLTRRQLVGALAVLGLGGQAPSNVPGRGAPFRGRTLNHVTLSVGNVTRSKTFYQQLLGLQVRNEDARSCRFPLENGFLALDTYPEESGHPRGIDHFCFGIDDYRAPEVFARLQRDQPALQPSLEYGDQVYLRDPDGVRVQLCGMDYKG